MKINPWHSIQIFLFSNFFLISLWYLFTYFIFVLGLIKLLQFDNKETSTSFIFRALVMETNVLGTAALIWEYSAIQFLFAIVQRIPHQIYRKFIAGYSYNENIKFCGKSLFFKSFLLSGLLTIRDAWDEEILNFKDSIQIYNSFLLDKRNCIYPFYLCVR
jgi:hypothetical protein